MCVTCAVGSKLDNIFRITLTNISVSMPERVLCGLKQDLGFDFLCRCRLRCLITSKKSLGKREQPKTWALCSVRWVQWWCYRHLPAAFQARLSHAHCSQMTVVFGVTPLGEGSKKTEEFPLRESGAGSWAAGMDHTVAAQRQSKPQTCSRI